MPVVSTEVLEVLQGLGLDDARAMQAAKAVGEAQSAVNDQTHAEVVRLRAELHRLRETLEAELKAARAESQAWVAAREEQTAAFAALAHEHRAAFTEQARAHAGAAERQTRAQEALAGALGLVKWLLVALILLNFGALLAALLT